MLDLHELSTLPLFSNSLLDWSIAASIALATPMLLVIARRVVRGHHAKMKATPETEILEIPLHLLSWTTLLFFVALAPYAGLQD